MKSLKYYIAGALAALALAAGLSVAQNYPSGAVQAITPMTRNLGALITFASQGAATVVSSDQSGYNTARVACTLRASAQTGTPSTTFSIQVKDEASGQYVSTITSSAITNSTATMISAGAGVATTANVGAGIPIGSKWRVSATVAGTATPIITGTVGCSAQ